MALTVNDSPDSRARHDPAAKRWELVQRTAAGPARRIVRDYWGYAEQTGASMRRRELPKAEIIVILNLGAPLTVEQPGDLSRIVPTGSGFVAGLHDTYTVTETVGSQSGVELRLSPLSAFCLFGQPMDALVNRTITFDELCRGWAVELTGRLEDAASWDARFATLDTALDRALAEAREPLPEIVWAWRQLAQSGGRVPIAVLREELGWSPRRLIARFREQIGMPPKQAARLLRFQRVAAELAAGAHGDWDIMASRHGFYDQAHLINEFQRFAGDTPEGLVRRSLGPGHGFAAD